MMSWTRKVRTTHSRAAYTRPWLAAAVLLMGALPLMGQAPGGPPSGSDRNPGSGPMMPHRPPMEHAFHLGPPGRWWDDPQMAKEVGIDTDQQKKMDDIFQQSRLKLIDQHAAVEKEEAILEPMLSADQPDEGKVLSQIDRVAQSRAELEKANARMLLGLRRVLTSAQWQSLRSMEPSRSGRGGFDGRDGRHDGRSGRGGDAPPLQPSPTGATREAAPNPPGDASASMQ